MRSRLPSCSSHVGSSIQHALHEQLLLVGLLDLLMMTVSVEVMGFAGDGVDIGDGIHGSAPER